MTLGEMDGTLQIVHDLVEEDSKTTISLQRPSSIPSSQDL